MKQLFTKLFTLIFAISLTTAAFGQSIGSVSVSPTPTNCTNTIVSVAATQLCINYLYPGVTSVVGTNTIDVYLDWTNASPICLGALSFINENVNLGQIPDGTYTLNVVARLNGVPQNTSTQSLVVASCCAVQASVQSLTNICLGDSVTLINTSTNATSSVWLQNGNNISTANAITLYFANPGTYPIQLSATNGVCSDVETVNIVVSNYPNVNLGSDTSACVGQPILLNAGVSGATSYLWSNGTTNSTISVTNSGTYSVVVSVNGCTGTDTVVVTSVPTPVFNLGANATICQGTILTLDATVNQPNVTYNWSNGGGTTPTLPVSSSGTYAVTATNSVGCSYSDNIVIAVQALPAPNLGSDLTLCEGQTAVLNGSVAGMTNYSWNTGATTAGLTVDMPGTYSVTVTTDNGCAGMDTVVVDYSIIEFNWNGTLDLAVTNPVILDAGNIGSTYLWNTGETTQTISVDTTGTYTVTVTTNAGCTEGSSVVVVNTTSTKNQLQNQVKVFPNPAQDFLVIENNNLDLQTAIITNSFGQIVGQIDIQNNKIAVNDLASGFYFIQFKNKNNEIIGMTRFIKQ